MKYTLAITALLLTGCTVIQDKQSDSTPISCEGSVTLPMAWQPYLAPIAEPTPAQKAMLERAIGEPQEGKLCQAQLYTLARPANAPLYRAWNSTNPNSRLGQWWAFDLPTGKVANYRKEYEICYQWSPLDKLVQCQLQAATTVVIGTGQSATCSPHLSYPASATLQIYLEEASAAMHHCTDADAVFAWE